jgi:hypothetical protein
MQMQREPACISTWLLCKEAKIGQDPLHPSESSGEIACFPFSKNGSSHVISRLMEGSDGKLLSCTHTYLTCTCKNCADAAGTRMHHNSNLAVPPPRKQRHSESSHKPPREERPRTRICMHRRLHAGNLTLPYLPLPSLPFSPPTSAPRTSACRK